ncbi:MAG: OmpH family outer membrane protein [Pseudomonadota bacterium]
MSLSKSIRITLAALAALWMVAAGPVAAQESSARIGVVNIAKLFQEAPQAQDANQRLEEEFGSRRQELGRQQEELQEKQEQLESEGDLMSTSQRDALEDEVRQGQQELAREQQSFEQDVNARRNEELGQVQQRIFEVIEELAKNEGYDVVLGDNVIYAADSVDITPRVLERLKSLAEDS